MKEELVSIIMPSYNTGKFIQETIDSVINQTYDNWELIIVDDCSSDNTDEIVKSIKDDRIFYLKNKKNSGAAVSRNKALKMAKGKWIAFLDSDDLWMPQKLEKQVRFMEENHYYFSYTDYEEINEDGQRTGVSVTGPERITKRGMYRYCWPGCLTVMYDAEKVGLLQIKDIKKNNDYAMWLKVCKKADCYLLKECLAEYRVRKKSISHDKFLRKVKSHYELFRKCEKKNIIYSVCNTLENMLFAVLKKKTMRKKCMKKEICIIGHLALEKELLNGQTIKTKIVMEELKKELGKSEVLAVDTYGAKKHLIRLFFDIGKMMRCCKNVVMMPAQNGVRFLSPTLWFWKKIFRSSIYYIVIGGWLSDFINEKAMLKNSLKSFDGIFVETNVMKLSLEQKGFKNIFIMPNCKNLEIIHQADLAESFSYPLKLCTFSRVMREKGIEDAINAVMEINKSKNNIVYSLDIYGFIEPNYSEKFKQMQKEFPKYIRYCGMVDYDQSTAILRNYYALLFPTKFYTEGIPGTIIDAYASGIPVISAKWESFGDIIDEKRLGYGYEFGQHKKLIEILYFLAEKPNVIVSMKRECLAEAEKYTSSNVVKEFVKNYIKK